MSILPSPCLPCHVKSGTGMGTTAVTGLSWALPGAILLDLSTTIGGCNQHSTAHTSSDKATPGLVTLLCDITPSGMKREVACSGTYTYIPAALS